MYAILLLFYRYGWLLEPTRVLNKEYTPCTKVSIIIPARNESKHIGALLNDIMSQYYPSTLMEVVVIDDHSTDSTAEIVRSFSGVHLRSLKDDVGDLVLNSYKKKAIEIGVRESSGELIITTDADCRLGPYWLLSIVSFYEKGRYKMIAGPVAMLSEGTHLGRFQMLDFITMQGITSAVLNTHSGSMCNGANLAYTRDAFEAVDGFAGIDEIASGDDMLLMYKINSKYKKKVAYLKSQEAIVSTYPMQSISKFMQQRIRWASKSAKLKDNRITAVLGFVYVFNLFFLILFLLGFLKPALWGTLATMLLFKSVIEYFFILPISDFFKIKREVILLFLYQPLHILYIIVSGGLGQFGAYTWKDRTVK